MDRMFTGDKGCKLVGWLRTSTVRDLKLKMPSISVIIVNEDSSSRNSLWVLKSDLRILMALAERTCCSQTPPIWLAKGGILCQLIQSPHCSCKKDWMLSSILVQHEWNYFYYLGRLIWYIWFKHSTILPNRAPSLFDCKGPKHVQPQWLNGAEDLPSFVPWLFL